MLDDMTEEPDDPSTPTLAPGGSFQVSSAWQRSRSPSRSPWPSSAAGRRTCSRVPTAPNLDQIPRAAQVRASVGGFCQRYAELVNVDDGQSVLDWAAPMAEVGTPNGLSGDGRAGFVVVLKRAERVDEDATVDDLVRRDENLGGIEARNVEAFTEYATSTCASQLESALREAASEELAP